MSLCEIVWFIFRGKRLSLLLVNVTLLNDHKSKLWVIKVKLHGSHVFLCNPGHLTYIHHFFSSGWHFFHIILHILQLLSTLSGCAGVV